MRCVLRAFAAGAVLALGVWPAMAMAQDWTVDSAASSLRFETMGYDGPLSGQFVSWSANISLDPDALDTATISARVETATAHTDAGSEIDDSITGEDGLQSAGHPLAEFQSSDVRATADGYEAVGVMTIRGTPQPVTLPFTLAITDGHAIADARLVIARADYGIGARSWGTIAAEVTLVLHIEADAAM
ncbi:YceI family protein [uncultured Maricaulis sp.]|uniref:YceI family protein n=1 Tax=uncultured Maricaulis sp. TaxID=174710 RepID=UPI0030DD8FB7|tara:strand:- start:40510 stop:41073 length:564 start_codon:yes stop_codon:yes gene_type:complete